MVQSIGVLAIVGFLKYAAEDSNDPVLSSQRRQSEGNTTVRRDTYYSGQITATRDSLRQTLHPLQTAHFLGQLLPKQQTQPT